MTSFWLEQEREFIDNFFNNRVPAHVLEEDLVDEEKCKNLAESIFGVKPEDIELVENQGENSYTLVCPKKSKIIQFRLKPLDQAMLDFAEKVYGNLVPRATRIPNDFPLPIYVSPLVPGRVHILQKFPPPGKPGFPLKRQLTTVTELARFVAKSAYWPQPMESYAATSITLTAWDHLDKIEKSSDLAKINPRFSEMAISLKEKVDLLKKLPPVLCYADFAEINIMVNDEGNVTGVIDFEDASIEAFGTCLGGVYEGFFGAMHYGKWNYFDQAANDGSNKSVRSVLEEAFWKTLWESVPSDMKREELEQAVMVALDLGIIHRFLFPKRPLKWADLGKPENATTLEFARGLLLDKNSNIHAHPAQAPEDTAVK